MYQEVEREGTLSVTYTARSSVAKPGQRVKMLASWIVEIVGWMGTVLILLAYFLLTQRRITGQSWVFHALNLVGAVGIVVNAVSNSAYPPAVLNLVWSFIAIYGIARISKGSKGLK